MSCYVDALMFCCALKYGDSAHSHAPAPDSSPTGLTSLTHTSPGLTGQYDDLTLLLKVPP